MDPIRLATCLDRSAAASGAIASTVSPRFPSHKLLSPAQRLLLVERPRRGAAHQAEASRRMGLSPSGDRWAGLRERPFVGREGVRQGAAKSRYRRASPGAGEKSGRSRPPSSWPWRRRRAGGRPAVKAQGPFPRIKERPASRRGSRQERPGRFVGVDIGREEGVVRRIFADQIGMRRTRRPPR